MKLTLTACRELIKACFGAQHGKYNQLIASDSLFLRAKFDAEVKIQRNPDQLCVLTLSLWSCN